MTEKKISDLIEQITKENKPLLRSSIIEFMDHRFNSIVRFGFVGTLRNDFDIDKTLKIINLSFDLENNPKFSAGSGVFFLIVGEDEMYPSNIEISKSSIERQKIFINEFLQTFKTESFYEHFNKEILNFDCFVEKTLKVDERIPNSIYNTEGWCLFLKQLFEILYLDFKYSEKQKTVRFSKNISSRLTIIFEYNRKEFESSLKRGILMLPDIGMSLLYKKESSDVSPLNIYLGKFENRFFRVLSLDGYKAVLNMEVTEDGVFEISGDVINEHIDKDNVRVFGNELKGQLYKEFTLFELYLKSVYNRMYLDYIEKTLVEVDDALSELHL